jgi:hypothetical protein
MKALLSVETLGSAHIPECMSLHTVTCLGRVNFWLLYIIKCSLKQRNLESAQMLKALKCDICHYGRFMKQGNVVETLVDIRKS